VESVLTKNWKLVTSSGTLPSLPPQAAKLNTIATKAKRDKNFLIIMYFLVEWSSGQLETGCKGTTNFAHMQIFEGFFCRAE
jgi:hypothetical protein